MTDPVVARLSLMVSPHDDDPVDPVAKYLAGFDQWMLEHDFSDRTINQRMIFARGRVRAWGTLDVARHVVVTWLRQFSGWTRNTYLGHLRCLYRWAVEAGLVEASPVNQLRSGPQPPPQPAPVPTALLERVIAEAEDRDLRTWIALGYLAGLRCHEMAQMHGRDIDATRLRVHGKGGVVAFLPTHPELWSIAQTYPRDDFWFPSRYRYREHVATSTIGNRLREHFRSIGISTGSVHRLRHTYVTELARSGVRMRVVQQLARHAQLNTTMRYDGTEQSELDAAIRRLSLPHEDGDPPPPDSQAA